MTKQERRDHSHSCITKHDHILLTWKGKFIQTIPLDQSNVSMFTLAPGYKNFEVFAAEAHIIPEDEDDHPILLTKGGNMRILSTSQTTKSRRSRNVQSKSTSTYKDHHRPSNSSPTNWSKWSQRMPLPSSFAIISDMDTCHPRRSKPWPKEASCPGAWLPVQSRTAKHVFTGNKPRNHGGPRPQTMRGRHTTPLFNRESASLST